VSVEAATRPDHEVLATPCPEPGPGGPPPFFSAHIAVP